ncbi:uncharacterized protein [Nicotiana sylvestris]|uniref:uncharacterized protein n=1 Tax=Nicotiana sylvestris TaxID=4096 RepID=UPI00388CA7FC
MGYADRNVRDVSYMVGERVLLRVSPMKGVMRFAKKGKLSPRFIGPFEILRRIGEVSNELALPPSLAGVHPFSSVQLDKDLPYVEEPVAILDRQVQKLRLKNIASVKIQWQLGKEFLHLSTVEYDDTSTGCALILHEILDSWQDELHSSYR